jgi:GntR family transcriptional regulator
MTKLIGLPDDQALGFRPLYRQVRDILVRRIADGVWQPGEAIPSENDIALDLGVSQGTVRKALDEMAADKIVVRRQGRGTYVAKHDDERMLFKFFKLVPDSGERSFPDSRTISAEQVHDEEASRALGLRPSDPVLRLCRIRSMLTQDCIFEIIHLPAQMFPGLLDRELPNNLYDLFAREFGITIGRSSEKLRAVAARATEAEALGLAIGTPLLCIDRIAYALDGRRIERRISLCRTETMHYLSDLR